MINKNIIFCLEYFLLIFLVGCTAFKNVPGEEYQYEQLSETPGIDAYQAIETIYSPEDAALMEEEMCIRDRYHTDLQSDIGKPNWSLPDHRMRSGLSTRG